MSYYFTDSEQHAGGTNRRAGFDFLLVLVTLNLDGGWSCLAVCLYLSGRRCSDTILTIYYKNTIRITKINVQKSSK